MSRRLWLLAVVTAAGFSEAISGSSIASEAAPDDKLDMLIELEANVPFELALARLDSDCGNSCQQEVRFARAVVAYNLSLDRQLSSSERIRYLRVATLDFDRVVSANPRDVLARRYLGLALLRSKADFAGAAEQFGVAWTLGAREADFVDAYAYILIAVGDHGRAETILASLPPDQRTFDSNYLRAAAQLALGKFTDAASSAKDALTIRESVRARILRASALSQSGSYSDALKELDVAQSIDRSNLNIARGRIAIFRETGDLDAALMEARRAARSHPEDKGIADLLDELEKSSGSE